MIRLSLGKIGSGKTLNEVREMIINKRQVNKVFTNINVFDQPHVTVLKPEMIIDQEIIKEIKKRDGTTEQKTKKKLNIDFWKKQAPPITVVIDEAYTMLNARRSMNATNIILNSFMAMLRRVLGTQDGHTGELVIIAQRIMQIDISVRESANQIRYHICHWKRKCDECRYAWLEDSEMPETSPTCLVCNSVKTTRLGHVIHIFYFESWTDFNAWDYDRVNNKTYYKDHYVTGISQYFNSYNTLQWENMFESEY